jgi:uronate dehydrogenase
MKKPFNRILITGAAGALGSVLRRELEVCADRLRLTDLADMGTAAAHEELVQGDLQHLDFVRPLMDGVDAIVHLGGIPRENTFNSILNSNIVGCYNVYESARQQGIKRVIFASSNHAIGFYERTQTIDGNVPHRPDSLYGLSKAFGEDLARYYFDKFGIESVCIRIGSCFPQPIDRRMLATWQSHADFGQLVRRALTVSRVGYMVVYGMSNNDESFWDNKTASSLGYRPKDSSEVYRDGLIASTPIPDPESHAVRYQGGGFAADGHFEDKR